MNTTLNTIDKIFGTLEVIETFDYVKLGEQVINLVITIAAVIVGVCTYALTAFQLYWLDNGEVITKRAKSAVEVIKLTASECYIAGRDLRVVIANFTA